MNQAKDEKLQPPVFPNVSVLSCTKNKQLYQAHNLAQAIARVNRVFKDKPGGLVVDYIGIAGALKRAMRTYTDAKGKGQPTVKAEDAFDILLEKIDVVRGMYHGFDYSAYKSKPLDVLIPAANHILGLEDGKNATPMSWQVSPKPIRCVVRSMQPQLCGKRSPSLPRLER